MEYSNLILLLLGISITKYKCIDDGISFSIWYIKIQSATSVRPVCQFEGKGEVGWAEKMHG